VRFLLLDRVVLIEKSKCIQAARGVSLSEDYFSEHFPGYPIMPASLVFEAFAQAGTCLLETSNGFRQKAVPGFIQSARFGHAVVPGHELTIEMSAQSILGDGALLVGHATQNGKRCATIALGMMLLPMEPFLPPAFLPFYLSVYESWLRDSRLEGFDAHPLDALRRAHA
jgi:3-hydroxymyristoyl/3-hydroxydecanoyl-(acyl carrier protein) dehydratase